MGALRIFNWRLLIVAFQIACLGSRPKPAELVLNEEICSHCRMAVSERQFAGEVVTAAGSVDYFDDIGCLARWLKEQQVPEGTGLFVVDYKSGEWLDAQTAHYVQSDQFSSPMRYGLTAFATSARAAAAAEEFEGRVLAWEQILGEESQ